MTRDEAYQLLKQHMKTKNLIKHSLAVEACMRRLARHFGENEEKWGLAGLLHDIDYDRTKDARTATALRGRNCLQKSGCRKMWFMLLKYTMRRMVSPGYL